MASPLQKLDISTLTNALGALAVREENPEERTARLNEEQAAAVHARWKDTCLFIGCGTVGLLLFFVSFGYAIWGSDADTRKWAQSVVTALAAGLIGYLVGTKK